MPLLSGPANCGFTSSFTTFRLRSAYVPLTFRLRSAYVPLKDAWEIELKGGGSGRTVEDLQKAFSAASSHAPAFVKGLFALRGTLGKLFGWDARNPAWKDESYISRLTASDRALTTAEPDSADGRFQFVYRFENELLSEVRNGTVHAFLSLSIQPSPTGYLAYLGVYVKPTGWFTRVYMSAIAPFRHLAVYPAMVRNTQKAWAGRFAEAHR